MPQELVATTVGRMHWGTRGWVDREHVCVDEYGQVWIDRFAMCEPRRGITSLPGGYCFHYSQFRGDQQVLVQRMAEGLELSVPAHFDSLPWKAASFGAWSKIKQLFRQEGWMPVSKVTVEPKPEKPSR